MSESIRGIHEQHSTCKLATDQSKLSDRARNWQRTDTVSIRKISSMTCQKLGNLQSQTGNY